MSDSPYTDLSRPPLSETALNRALVHSGSLWRDIQVVPETGSSNTDLAALVRDRPATPEGTVLIAEAQTAGRGRLGRTWAAPPRSGLMFSILLRPGAGPADEAVPVSRQGWLPLLTGVAVASAVRRITTRAKAGDFGAAPEIPPHKALNERLLSGRPVRSSPLTAGRPVRPTLKWPNDLLVGDRKLAGILAERVDDAVIVGVGLNVGLRAEELPVPTATSLEIEGAAMTDRGILLRAILREFEAWYLAWRRVQGTPDTDGPGGYPALNDPDLDPAVDAGQAVSDRADLGEAGPTGGLRGAYRRLCSTLGREVRVELPGYLTLTGVARDVDTSGCLVVATAAGERTLSAGDVIHLRPTN